MIIQNNRALGKKY